MQEPFLSVVVPVYNVESYLPDLLGSLRAFEGRSVEIIFVEDCSTDQSGTRLAEFRAASALDIRIVRHEHNQGLSAARNTGLARAQGRYVWFIDSDDVVNSAEVADWFNVLQARQPDVIAFDFLDFGAGFVVDLSSGSPILRAAPVTSLPSPRSTAPGTLLSGSHEVMAQALRDLRLHAWSYCFRRSLLSPDPFPVGRVYEDIATIPRLLHAARTVYYHAAPLILYRNRPDSISKRVSAKRDLDLAHAMRRDWQYIATNRSAFTKLEQTAYLATWLKTLLWSMTNLHTAGLFGDEDVFREYADNWRAYIRAAGWRHALAIRRLPRPTIPSLGAAVVLSASPRAARALMRIMRPAKPAAAPSPTN